MKANTVAILMEDDSYIYTGDPRYDVALEIATRVRDTGMYDGKKAISLILQSSEHPLSIKRFRCAQIAQPAKRARVKK